MSNVPGFYWVRRGDWLGVMELDEDGDWLMPGKEYAVNPEGVIVLGDRLEAPEEGDDVE